MDKLTRLLSQYYEERASRLGLTVDFLRGYDERLERAAHEKDDSPWEFPLEPIVDALGPERAQELVAEGTDLRRLRGDVESFNRFAVRDGYPPEHPNLEPVLTVDELQANLALAGRRIDQPASRDKLRKGMMPSPSDLHPWLRERLCRSLEPSGPFDPPATGPEMQNPMIESARDMLTGMKLEVVSRLGNDLHQKVVSIREIFLDALKAGGERDLVLLALDEERRISNCDESTKEGSPYPRRLSLPLTYCSCPGLRALFSIGAHCEAELKRPTFSAIAGALVKPDGNGWFESYWELFAANALERWKESLTAFQASYVAYKRHFVEFGGVAIRLLQRANLSAQKPRGYIAPAVEASAVVSRRPLLPSTFEGSWTGFTLVWRLDEGMETVGLEVGGAVLRRISPQDLNLSDRRKAIRLTKTWMFLLELIADEVRRPNAAGRERRSDEVAPIPIHRGKLASRLRKALSSSFGLPGDPLPIIKGRGWVPAFNVRFER